MNDIDAIVRALSFEDLRDGAGGEPKVFFNTEQRTVTIRDMRPLVSDLSLDRQGFVLCQHTTLVEDLYDDDLVDDVDVRELDALLKESAVADCVGGEWSETVRYPGNICD